MWTFFWVGEEWGWRVGWGVFEEVISVPGSAFFILHCSRHPFGRNNNLFAHSFGNTVCQCGSYFHPRCGMLMLCSDSEDVWWTETLEPWLSLLPPSVTGKQEQTKKQDGRGVKESQKQSSRSGKFYTGQRCLLYVKNDYINNKNCPWNNW